jgi:alkylation response protein AidB-like acyl-CoA dehydrogenase
MTAVLHPSLEATRVAAATDLTPDLASRAAQHDRDGSFPFASFGKLAEASLLNLTVPVQYGGDGPQANATRVPSSANVGETVT